MFLDQEFCFNILILCMYIGCYAGAGLKATGFLVNKVTNILLFLMVQLLCPDFKKNAIIYRVVRVLADFQILHFSFNTYK